MTMKGSSEYMLGASLLQVGFPPLNEWNDLPEIRKLSHSNHCTGTSKPLAALPLNTERQARKLQLLLLKPHV